MWTELCFKKVELEGRKKLWGNKIWEEDSEMSWELRILEIFFGMHQVVAMNHLCVAKKCWIMRILQEFEKGDLQ